MRSPIEDEVNGVLVAAIRQLMPDRVRFAAEPDQRSTPGTLFSLRPTDPCACAMKILVRENAEQIDALVGYDARIEIAVADEPRPFGTASHTEALTALVEAVIAGRVIEVLDYYDDELERATTTFMVDGREYTSERSHPIPRRGMHRRELVAYAPW